MRRELVIGSFVVSLAILSTLPSSAGTKRRQVTRRQVHQEERIHQGVKSGELTPEETRELQREQHQLQKAKHDATRDGKISLEEQKNLNQMENAASKDIYEEKHDAEKR